MRSGFGVAFAMLALAACSDRPSELAAKWGCGPVEGLKAVRDPGWVLIGEFTETNEAPAAIADIACNLVTDERKLFVGVSEYVGGASDAETRLLARLDEMIAKGAPITVARIGGEERPYSIRERSKSEKLWADALTAKVRESGAARALLFVSRADAMASHIPPAGERFAGYDPMATFLEGRVVSLEVAANPIAGAPGPAIRIRREMQNGFHGQLALQSLTRPMIAMVIPEATAEHGESAPVSETLLRQMDEQLKRLQGSRTDVSEPGLGYSASATPDRDAILDQLDDDLPQFKAE